jgi:amino-acid N-acetyltransferase
MGEDLAEVRTTAIAPEYARKGVGKAIVAQLIEEGKRLGVKKVFALTYQPEFFQKCGFTLEDKNNMPLKVWTDCVNCPKFPNCDEICMSQLI